MASNRSLTISVVIPLFNKADYLKQAIESVLGQSRRPQEILVIDDGSTDGGDRIVRDYASTVQLVCVPHAGVSAARNRGIEMARGQLVAFLDADDVWKPRFVENVAGLLERFPGSVRGRFGLRILDQATQDCATAFRRRSERFLAGNHRLFRLRGWQGSAATHFFGGNRAARRIAADWRIPSGSAMGRRSRHMGAARSSRRDCIYHGSSGHAEHNGFQSRHRCFHSSPTFARGCHDCYGAGDGHRQETPRPPAEIFAPTNICYGYDQFAIWTLGARPQPTDRRAQAYRSRIPLACVAALHCAATTVS